MIEITDVTKNYGRVQALCDLSITVPKGSIFGLLGPNGAGKTTLLRLIVGLIRPGRGTINVMCAMPQQLGYLPERPHFPTRFRLGEYLHASARISGLLGSSAGEVVEKALHQTGLSSVSDRRIGACSKGMIQRLALAQALILDPPLLLLDEPFSGLDPGVQSAMRQLLREKNRNGVTVLISTHRLSDVTELCTDIAILSKGQISRRGTLQDVLIPQPQVIISVDALLPSIAQEIRMLHPAIAIDENMIFLPGQAIAFKPVVLRQLIDHQIEVVRLEQQRATLEDVYLEAVQATNNCNEVCQ